MGIEPPSTSTQNRVLFEQGGAESGAFAMSDRDLASLIMAWPQLPEPIKTGILAMVRASSG